ncbi:MAG TPA: hypothetical protein VFD70_00145 [Anaerolineae bacterium]|nr:hypothetical protein [Anaerolineae bacterium]
MAAKKKTATSRKKDSTAKGVARKSTRAAPSQIKDSDAVFERLKQIYEPYASTLTVKEDKPGNYVLVGTNKQNKEQWVGAVQTNKNYVSFHLMPIYACPDLLAGMSPELKKRMQGKSCFNFTTVQEPLMEELSTLTTVGLERFRERGYLV